MIVAKVGVDGVVMPLDATLLVIVEFVLLVVVCDIDVGGVDEPNRDGIETDDSEEVEETGEGIAETPVEGGGNPFVVTAEVVDTPEFGPNKFEIVGGCLIAGDIDCCFELGEFDDVVDVVVHVEGILAAVDTGLIPFCVATAG